MEEKQLLSYRYRLLPTREQHAALCMILESQRQLYNAALEERIACYRKTGRTITLYDQQKGLTECRRDLPEMALLPTYLQRATLHRLDQTYRSFFRRAKAGEKAGFPRFKGKGWFNSFGFREFRGISFDGKRLRLKGMSGGLRVHLHRSLPTMDIRSCTFRRDAKGWLVSFAVPVETANKRDNIRAIGLDMGLTTLAATSDSELIPNPRAARKAQIKMRVRQRALARCRKGSMRRRKVRAEVTRLHAKIANTRKTYLHQVSARLVRDYDLIAIEALNIKCLSRGILARSVHDAGWGNLIEFLRYKAARAGAQLIEVDPRFTSQTCPDCGTVAPKTLADRVHSCPCGCIIDRDVAAARVILSRAVVGPGLGNVTGYGERRAGNLNTLETLP